jgi:hypothetical protein
MSRFLAWLAFSDRVNNGNSNDRISIAVEVRPR